MDKKVISKFEKIISICKEDGCDFVDLTFETAEQILALLKEQEADIKNLNGTITNLLPKITEMKMIYGDCEYVGELVRCKDCKHWVGGGIDDKDNFIPPRCNNLNRIALHDWFCADGERKVKDC